MSSRSKHFGYYTLVSPLPATTHYHWLTLSLAANYLQAGTLDYDFTISNWVLLIVCEGKHYSIWPAVARSVGYYISALSPSSIYTGGSWALLYYDSRDVIDHSLETTCFCLTFRSIWCCISLCQVNIHSICQPKQGITWITTPSTPPYFRFLPEWRLPTWHRRSHRWRSSPSSYRRSKSSWTIFGDSPKITPEMSQLPTSTCACLGWTSSGRSIARR